MKLKFNCRINFTYGNNHTQNKKKITSVDIYPRYLFLHLFRIVTFTSFTASFPTFCGAGFSNELPPRNPFLRLLLRQSLLLQFYIHTVYPPPLWSSFTSPHHIHHHHFPHIFFFPSHDISVPFYPYFLHFLSYFSHFLCPYKYSILYSVHLCPVSTTSNSFSCDLSTAHVSAQCIIGLNPNCPPPIVVFYLCFLSRILSLILILFYVTHNVYVCQSVSISPLSLLSLSLSLTLSLSVSHYPSPSPFVIQRSFHILHNGMCMFIMCITN